MENTQGNKAGNIHYLTPEEIERGEKLRAQYEAGKMAGADMAWMTDLQTTDKGGIHPNIYNAVKIVQHDPALSELLSYNLFSREYSLLRRIPGTEEDEGERFPRTWDHNDVTMMQAYMQKAWHPRFSIQTVEGAMWVGANSNQHHPIREYLDSLEWDGVNRVDGWLSRAFGCDDNEYTRAVGKKFLVAAVRRVKNPGCKFDYMMVLEGDQGIGKSTSMSWLFTTKWHTDQLHMDVRSKDTQMALSGAWCIEFAEIGHIIRTEVQTMKSFISSQYERFRPPYGKEIKSFPRQCIFVGTTNEPEYLKDLTGNRRFWPIKCSKADKLWVIVNRDQLWAEACEMEAAGATTYFDETEKHIEATATRVQEKRTFDQVLVEPVMAFCKDKKSVSLFEVMQALGNQYGSFHSGADKKIAQILKRGGWEGRQTKVSGVVYRRWFNPAYSIVGDAQ